MVAAPAIIASGLDDRLPTRRWSAKKATDRGKRIDNEQGARSSLAHDGQGHIQGACAARRAAAMSTLAPAGAE